MEETLTYFGGSVKALDDSGRIGGYLVRFTDADHKDLVGDYFTDKTYLGAREGDGCDVFFHHRQPVGKGLEEFTDHVFSPLKTTRDKIGIFAETVLNLADKYEEKVFELVKKGKLGFSSGAAGHLVKRAADGELKMWVIAEGSLTPTPAEPLNRVLSIKALEDVDYVSLDDTEEVKKWDVTENELRWRVREPDLFDEKSFRRITLKKDKPQVHAIAGKLKGEDSMTIQALRFPKDEWTKAEAGKWLKEHPEATKKSIEPEIKGIFEEQLAENTPGVWQLQSAFEMSVRKLATVAASTSVTGVEVDVTQKVNEAVAEYSQRLAPLVINQINEYVESGSNEHFYLKSSPLDELAANEEEPATSKFADHLQLVLAANQEVQKRAKSIQELRIKAGRVLSEANRSRLSKLLESLQACMGDIEMLLQDAEPKPKSVEQSELLTLLAEFEHTQMLIDTAPLRS